ncbi:hypothetical protein MRY82_06995 [bacterium]|nr:hypothetical protein [bacterium]
MAVKKNLKVLLVEQDLDNALSLEFIKEDWEIVRYSHPTEVNVAKVNNYDVAFLDIVFKSQSGGSLSESLVWSDPAIFKYTEKLIEDIVKVNPSLPIMLLTAIEEDFIKKKSKIYNLCPNVLYMGKPVSFDSEYFNNKLNDFLENL